MLLEVVDQIENNLSEIQDEVTELCNNEHMVHDDGIKEEFLDITDTESVQENFEKDVSSHGHYSDKEESFLSTQALDEDTQETFLADEHERIIEKPSTSSRTSKKKSNPESWMRNKRKLAKNTGQPYIASNGKFIEAKQMKSNCGESCRMNCTKKITEENRLKNFTYFYQLADIAKQRKFLFEHMKTYEPRRNKLPKNPLKIRAVQRSYFLNIPSETDENEMVQVCKLMFLNTFSISSQMIDTLHRKAINEGRFSDTRGKFDRKHSKAHDFACNMLQS